MHLFVLRLQQLVSFVFIASGVLLVTGLWLLLGFLLWFPLTIRSLFTFAVVLLCHAIVGKRVKGSIPALEKDIVLYLTAIGRAWSLLAAPFKTNNALSLAGTEHSVSNVRTEPHYEIFKFKFWKKLAQDIWEIIKQVALAVIFWLGLIIILSHLGNDPVQYLRYLFQTWAESTVVVKGLWLLPFAILCAVAHFDKGVWLIRLLLTVPFVIVCITGWIVIGLYFWIPMLVFAWLENFFGGIQAIIRKKSEDKTQLVLDAILYYAQGFVIITDALGRKAEIYSDTVGQAEQITETTYFDEFMAIAGPLVQKFTTATATYIAAIIACYFYFGSIDFLADVSRWVLHTLYQTSLWFLHVIYLA